jgi:predicted DNA-binding protein (MmcQ/YjbR family)
MTSLESIHQEVMDTALGYPETYEERPWGERVVKVRGPANGKIFMFSSVHEGRFHFTVKLPHSGPEMLTRGYAAPTGYGMGKSGWVTFRFERPEDVPLDEIPRLIDESFRALAPRRVVKQLDAPVARPETKKAPSKRGPRVALVGHDEARRARARAELEGQGAVVACEAGPDPAGLAAVSRGKAQVVVVDLGRRAGEGLEFARYLVDDLGGKIRLVFAGARDAAVEKRAAGFDGASIHREPPGDPAVIERVLRAR